MRHLAELCVQFFRFKLDAVAFRVLLCQKPVDSLINRFVPAVLAPMIEVRLFYLALWKKYIQVSDY